MNDTIHPLDTPTGPSKTEQEAQALLQQLPDAMVLDFLRAAAQTVQGRGLAVPSGAAIESIALDTAEQERVRAKGWMSEYDAKVWDRLTLEQAEQVGAAKEAMADLFDVPKEDFSIVLVEPGRDDPDPIDERQDVYVVYTADQGLPVSARFAFGEGAPDLFSVELDGKVVDTRKGMTLRVYDAMLDAWKAVKLRGAKLPEEELAAWNNFPEGIVRSDEERLSNEAPSSSQGTLLSGELIGEGLQPHRAKTTNLPVGWQFKGRPHQSLVPVPQGESKYGFRPALCIGSVYGSTQPQSVR